MPSLAPHSLKPPRLRVRDELLQACPELAELLGEQERRLGSAGSGLSGKVKNVQMAMTSAAGRSLLAGSLLEEEVSQEERLRRDMEAVKAERAYLLEQLAQVKLDPGKAGDDLQQEDIQFLHRELDIKKAKLNELHEEQVLTDKEVAQLILTSQDCARLMPDGSPEAQARLAEVKAEHEQLDVDLAEAEAKHRLYTLLEARTKRELIAMAAEVAKAQHLQGLYEDDEAELLLYVHAMKAALEDALGERQRAELHHEATCDDWSRKLKDRRNEVRELQRRQQEDTAREERRLKAIADKEAAERDKRAQLKMQEEAFALKLQAIQPKLEALEEAWSRLHTITGADSPDKLIAYWKGLKVQEESMHDLARMAEARQAEAKQELEGLLAERSKLLEAASEAAQEPSQEDAPGSGAVVEAAEDERALERLEEAARRSEVARKQFGRLRDVCIAAQQVLDREEIFELHAQGVQAIYTRIDTSLARLDAHAGRGSPDRRPSSETSVTGRRAGSFVRQSTFARTGSMKREAVADMPSGATLQRLYTIDQDAFFPDLPPLVQSTTEKVQALVALAAKMAQEDGARNAAAAEEPSAKVLPVADTTLRRRTWTGPPWLAILQQQGLPPIDPRATQWKGANGPRVDPSRLVGYTDGPAVAADAVHEEDNGDEWDGVVNRHIIKNRALKIVQKHKASSALKVAAKK